MDDKLEHVCGGCFEIIAPFAPGRFQKGGQWFHSTHCEERFHERSYALALRRMNLDARKTLRDKFKGAA